MTQSSQPWAPPVAESERRSIVPRWRIDSGQLVRRAGAVLAIGIAGSWIGFYLITQPPYLVIHSFEATVAMHIVTAAVFIPYLCYLVYARRLPGGSMLDVPIGGLLAAYLLATATSLHWRVSLEVTLIAIMGIGIFYVLSDRGLLSSRQLETAFMLAIIATAVRAMWFVGQDYWSGIQLADAVSSNGIAPGDLIPPTVPKIRDVGDHANLIGAVLAMSLPFFLAGGLRRQHPVLRTLTAVGGILVATAVFFSLARSAWAGAGLGLAVTALAIYATPSGLGRLNRWFPQSNRQHWTAAIAVTVLTGALVAGAILVLSSTHSRPIWLFRDSGTPRVDVLRAGWHMLQDYPLLGTGPGMFSLLYPQYSGKFPNHAFHAHNGFLQGAVDMGIAGIVAEVALGLAAAWLIVRGLREADGDTRLTLAACAGALVAFAVFSLFDSPNGYKGPLVALASVGAIAVLSEHERFASAFEVPTDRWQSIISTAQLIARVAVPVAMVGVLITWARLDGAHYFYSNAVSSANAGDWSQAIDDAQEAVKLDPEFAIYRLQLGAIEGQSYLAENDEQRLREGVYQLRRGVEMEPRSAVGHANLAMLLARTSDRDAARQEALRAIEFANSDPAVVLAAGTALEQAGWDEDATHAYSQAIFLDVNLADSPFWSQTSFRRDHVQQIIGDSALVFNWCTQLQLSMANIPTGGVTRDQALIGCAEQIALNDSDSKARITYANALIQDDSFDESRMHIDAVIAREPDFGAAHTALGNWYAAQGQTDGAREEWVRAGRLGDVDALVSLGDTYPQGGVPADVVDLLQANLNDAASEVQFHLTGILYYRFKFYRGSPITILLPGDWQQAVPSRYARAQDALARWTNQ